MDDVVGNFQPTFLSDMPVIKDRLDGLVDNYADLLCQMIKQDQGGTTIGILGEWGSGKTSLLHILEDKLDPQDPDTESDDSGKTIKTVFFESWRYENDPAPLAALLISIIEALHSNHFLKGLLDKNETAISACRVIKSFCSSVTVNTGLVRFALKDAIASIEKDLKEDKKRNMAFLLSEMDNGFHRFFDELRLAMSECSEKKLVVFIDDLDRCGERALDILDVTKSLFNIKNIIFVVGINPAPVSSWLKGKYPSSEITAREYLEKIINIPINIPPHIWASRINLHDHLISEIRLPEPYEDAICRERLKNMGSIRNVKRILNRFSFIARLDIIQGSIETDDEIDKAKLLGSIIDLIILDELFSADLGKLSRDRVGYLSTLLSENKQVRELVDHVRIQNLPQETISLFSMIIAGATSHG